MSSQKTEAVKYLEGNVNILLKPLMVDLLKEKPTKVCDYIVDWIQKKGRPIE